LAFGAGCDKLPCVRQVRGNAFVLGTVAPEKWQDWVIAMLRLTGEALKQTVKLFCAKQCCLPQARVQMFYV